MKLNILFPVLNEHKRLERGIRMAALYLEMLSKKEGSILYGEDYRLTIVDNGSDDDTPEIGAALAAQYEEVEYVRIEERGVGIAFRTGVEQNEAEIVGYMDIDLSTDLRNLAKMLRIFDKYPQVSYVNASRFHRKSVVTGRKWYRKITSAGLLILLKACFGMKATDAICGFTFMRRDTACSLVRQCSGERGWFYMIELLLRAERSGVRIVDLPVRWREDYDTTVKIPKTVKNYLINSVKLKAAFIMTSCVQNRKCTQEFGLSPNTPLPSAKPGRIRFLFF